jgi:hypothetical protein
LDVAWKHAATFSGGERRQDLVVAHIGDAARGAALPQQHETPIQVDELALAIVCLPNDRGDVAREDRRLALDRRCPVVTDAE